MSRDSLIEIDSIIEHIYVNSNNQAFVSKQIEKLKSIGLSDKKLVRIMEDIIITLEEAVSIHDTSNYGEKINYVYSKVHNMMRSSLSEILQGFNNELKKTNVEEFYIINDNGFSLTIAGSFDCCYYHEVEIKFSGVAFRCIPANMVIDNIRLATSDEIDSINRFMPSQRGNYHFICLEYTIDPDERYYIVAKEVSCEWGIVYYYNRENLLPGERLADWVK